MPPVSHNQEQEDEEDYFLPLEDQSVFGAGIRRKRVQFVRSSEHELNTTTRPSSTPAGPSIANAYLSIVLKQNNKDNTSPSTPAEQEPSPRDTHSAPPASHTSPPPSTAPTFTKSNEHCEICNLPLSSDKSIESSTTTIDRPHEASLAHQVCLTHSHPPSHLDRTHVGLRYLSTYGWDPDSRLGVGAPGREGIREPLKARVKNDTAGLGAGLDADGDPIKAPPPPPKKVQKMNAKQMRKNQVEERKKAEKLRNMFFMNDDVLKYLGEEV